MSATIPRSYLTQDVGAHLSFLKMVMTGAIYTLCSMGHRYINPTLPDTHAAVTWYKALIHQSDSPRTVARLYQLYRTLAGLVCNII